MSRYHRCDHRSDQQCPVCARDQVDYERELDKCDGSLECPARFHVIGCPADNWHTPPTLYLVPPPQSGAHVLSREELQEHAEAGLGILNAGSERCLGDPNLGQRTHRLVPDPGPS